MPARQTEWPVTLATERWLFHASNRCTLETGRIRFYGTSAARGWLRRFQADPPAMRQLRATVANCTATAWQLRDDAFLAYVAGLLASGSWHVHFLARPKIQGGSVQDAIVPAVRPPSVVKQAGAEQESVAPPDDADTFSGQTDGAATAAGLRAASASGVPFCEECAKEAALRAANA